MHRLRATPNRVGYPAVDYPTLTLCEAFDIASTGDIWLFRGRSAADLAIRALTNSPVNHVGMVVAIDDLPPLLWHAELGRSLPEIQRHHEDRLMETIARFDGRAFPANPGLIMQWAKGRVRHATSLETIYCAELVATTYQQMGSLASVRPPSWYDPGRFRSGDRLKLVSPFALDDEIAVR